MADRQGLVCVRGPPGGRRCLAHDWANWSHGYKVCKNVRVVGQVPALDPLMLAPVSARFLSQVERLEIADLRRAGQTIRKIAAAVGRSPSTVSELRRNARTDGRYRPFEAHRKVALRRRRHRPAEVMVSQELLAFVAGRLTWRWSPRQISRDLRMHFPSRSDMQLRGADLPGDLSR